MSLIKRCSRCGEVKPLSEFHTCSTCKDGYRNTCKKCRSAICTMWSHEHPEKTREIKRRWVETNQEHKREQDRQWRANNMERYKRNNKAYYEANKKRHSAYSKARYREKHPIRRSKSDPIRQRTLKKMAKHRYRARQRSFTVNFTRMDWLACLDYWHNCCAYCGAQQGFWNTITADHWIPLNDPNCPGTVRGNMLPACKQCNCSKNDREPTQWLQDKFGKQTAQATIARVELYFEWVTYQ